MKRGRLPLTALRSFEAAGRLKSFTRAADELFVSQAAISRQVRDLEQLTGQALFRRVHRGVELTEAGARLLAVLVSSFDAIDAGLAEIGGTSSAGQVQVSAEPAFASHWLLPKLAEFRALHPDIDISVDADPRVIDFRTHQAEIAIRCGARDAVWPRTQARLLTDSGMVPVMAPSFVGALPITADDLARLPLLHEETRDLWARWFRAAGVADQDRPSRGPIFADGALTLQAALRGHGIALAERFLAADDIAAGRLVQPLDIAVAQGSYFLVVRDFAQLSPPARLLADWIAGHFDPA